MQKKNHHVSYMTAFGSCAEEKLLNIPIFHATIQGTLKFSKFQVLEDYFRGSH